MIPKVLFTFRTSEFLGFDFSSHEETQTLAVWMLVLNLYS